MSKIAQVAVAVLAGVLVAAAPMDAAPVQPLFHAPLAIIEGGTVSTLPKTVKARSGRIVVLRGRADRVAKPQPRPAARTTTARAKDVPREASRTCACAGGSASDVVELRSTEAGLRVVVIGPDGTPRSRYVSPVARNS